MTLQRRCPYSGTKCPAGQGPIDGRTACFPLPHRHPRFPIWAKACATGAVLLAACLMIVALIRRKSGRDRRVQAIFQASYSNGLLDAVPESSSTHQGSTQ